MFWGRIIRSRWPPPQLITSILYNFHWSSINLSMHIIASIIDVIDRIETFYCGDPPPAHQTINEEHQVLYEKNATIQAQLYAITGHTEMILYKMILATTCLLAHLLLSRQPLLQPYPIFPLVAEHDTMHTSSFQNSTLNLFSVECSHASIFLDQPIVPC